MTAGFTHAFTVKVRARLPKNRWGDSTAGTSRDVPGCWMYTTTSTELVDGRQTTIERTVLLAPYGTQVEPVEEVEIPDTEPVPAQYRGRTYKVDGAASPWRSPFTGWAPGTEITLLEVTG